MVDWVAVVLAKKEVTYGTDSVPTAAANGILTRNYSAKPVEMDRIERNLDQQVYGALASAPSGERRTLTYEVELAGAGTVDTIPAWMELLEGCGMAAPVVTADEKVEQQFAAPGVTPSALTHYDYLSDQRRKAVGSVGTFDMDFTAGAYPFLSFTWLGLIPAATPFSKSAPGAVDLTRWKKPVEVDTENTEVLLGGYAANLRSWKAQAGVNTALRKLVGQKYVRRGNHAFTSTAVIEAPDIATKDYIQTLRSGDMVGFSLVHGTEDGNIIELSSAQCQITDISESKEDDVVMWTVTLLHTVDGGAADLLITTK